MKDFYYGRPQDVVLSLKAQRLGLGKRELVLLDFSPFIGEENKELLIKKFSQQTERLFVKLSPGEKREGVLTCLKWAQLAPLEYSIPPKDFFLHPWERHLEDAGLPLRYLKENPNCRAIELELHKENLEALLAALMVLKEADLDFIVLESTKLSLREDAGKLREIFSYLEKNGRKDIPLFFSPSNPLSENWEAETRNPFRGPRLVDIDLANACNHDCVFCGLHHPELKGENLEWKKKIFPEERLFKLIEELPPSVELVTLGGAGEPFIHPRIMDVITKLREKNIQVCVYSNLSLLTPEKWKKLNELVTDSPLDLWLLANVSGADFQSYKMTKPSQGVKEYFKLTTLLAYHQKFFASQGPHLNLTLMCVVNTLNQHCLPEYVAFAKAVGATSIWFKDIEPHGEVMREILLKGEEKKFKAWASYAARKLEVSFLEGEAPCEEEAIPAQALETYPLLKAYLEGKKELPPKNFIFKRPRFAQRHFQKETRDAGPSSFEDRGECFVPYDYLRLNVEGEASICCAMSKPQGKMEDKKLMNLWQELGPFRGKIKKGDYAFCAHCPHKHINRRFNSLLF